MSGMYNRDLSMLNEFLKNFSTNIQVDETENLLLLTIKILIYQAAKSESSNVDLLINAGLKIINSFDNKLIDLEINKIISFFYYQTADFYMRYGKKTTQSVFF